MRKNSTPLIFCLAGCALCLACVALLILVTILPHNSAVSAAKQHKTQIRHVALHVARFTQPSPLVRENHLPGTTQWMIPSTVNTTFIQGYAGAASALPGTTVPLYVSSFIASTFTLDVYRMGWYNGLGGRRYAHITNLHSPAQGTWTAQTGLVGCTTCTIDPTTHLLEAHWRPVYHLAIGTHWLSGFYLIKLTDSNDAASYIPLVVRALTGTALALADVSFNTYQAYNNWGGYNLYGGNNADDIEPSYIHSAAKVSYDRPYNRSAGSGDFLAWDIHLIRWMERSGLDVSYTTDVDMAAEPTELLQHRAIIILGHGEYWTKSMRDGLEQARDHGVSLAFLGADDGYWQARLEPDAAGIPDRTVVCYKVTSNNYAGEGNTLARDPDYHTHPDQVTALWRDPFLNRPESELLGLEYHSIILAHTAPAWEVPIWPLDPLDIGTGLQPGEQVEGGFLGYEYDGFGPAWAQPAGLHILGLTSLVNRYHHHDFAVTAYYRAPSGALVFDAGSIWWAWALDESSPPQAFEPNIVGGKQSIANLTYTIIAAMLRGHR